LTKIGENVNHNKGEYEMPQFGACPKQVPTFPSDSVVLIFDIWKFEVRQRKELHFCGFLHYLPLLCNNFSYLQ